MSLPPARDGNCVVCGQRASNANIRSATITGSGPAVREHPGPWPTPTGGADMADSTCSIEGCDKPKSTRGWCRKHYTRWRRHGDPHITFRPRQDGPCSVDGCDADAQTRGWCNMHYARWQRHGDPNVTQRLSCRADTPAAERFWSKVQRGPRWACWIWRGATSGAGHGRVRWEGTTWLAHRVAYLLAYGELPPSTVHIDHVCQVSACVNPEHLRAVSPLENSLNSDVTNVAKTHCIHGHEYTEENTYRTPRGHRRCRTCMRESDAKRPSGWQRQRDGAT